MPRTRDIPFAIYRTEKYIFTAHFEFCILNFSLNNRCARVCAAVFLLRHRAGVAEGAYADDR